MSDGWDFVMGLIAVALLFIGAASGGAIVRSQIHAQAIERGYAIYCPQDGRFAWIGECAE